MTGKTTNFTLATWANIPTASEKGCLIHIGASNGSDGYSLGIGDTSFDDVGNNLIFEACPNQWTVLRPIDGTGWHHVAAVVGSLGNIKGYVDGGEATVPAIPAAQDYVDLQRGLFLHFSMATFVGTEFVDANTPVNTFAPTGMDIAQWVQVAADFGATYAHLTVKHRDGFCLWPTAYTTRSIASTTWYAANGNPDITQIFCDECRARGIQPCFYFSVADLNWIGANPDYTNDMMKSFIEGQVTELLSRYGPIAAIWLDSSEIFFADQTPWASSVERAAFFHGVANGGQTGIIMVNNAHTGSLADSDVVEYEETVAPSDADPKESCFASASSWFWQSDTQTLVDAGTMGERIMTCNARNATALINVAPNTSGIIPAQFVTRLNEINMYLGETPRISPNNMTSNTAPSPYVASASTEYPGFPAYKSFNSSLVSFWSSNGALPQWIQIDVGSSQLASKYMVQNRWDNATNQPTAWTLEGSNNGSTWTSVDSRTKAVGVGGAVYFYDMTSPGTYRYWRWTITGSNSGSNADFANLALF